MDIYINNSPISFRLNEETKLGEVIDSIEEWLEEDGLCIQKLVLDSTELPIFNRALWETRDLEHIKLINITVISLAEKKVYDLDIISRYFRDLQKILELGKEEQLASYKAELSYIMEALKTMLPYWSNIELIAALKKAGLLSEPLRLSADINILRRTISSIQELLNILSEYRLYLVDKYKFIAQRTLELERENENIEQIVIAMQKSNDTKAMEQFNQLLQHLQLLRIMSADYADLNTIYTNMKPILYDLEEAMKAKDTVLFGDLLEYEISEHLSNLLSSLKEIGAGQTIL